MELFSDGLMPLIYIIFDVYSTFLIQAIKLELGLLFLGVKADNFPPIKTHPKNYYLSLFHDE